MARDGGGGDGHGVRIPAAIRSPWAAVAAVALVSVLALSLFSASGGRSRPGSPGVFRPAKGGPLPPPHGQAELVDLLVPETEARALRAKTDLPQLQLSLRQECDVELLITGGFTPLAGFMTEAQYSSVLEHMRLSPDGAVFPMPITLDVSEKFAASLKGSNAEIALRDRFSNLVAVMTVTSQWRPDKMAEAQAVFGTTDDSHPGVDYLLHTAGPVYLGGTLKALATPHHFDFGALRMTPRAVREYAASLGWSSYVAFQTRNPMHRAHIELTKLAAASSGAGVLIHPVVGMTKPGDVDYQVRVRCYEAVLAGGRHYAQGGAMLALLPLAMRMAGPREALWHAIIRKNHGATHFIVGRDHAGCKSSAGKSFYGDYDAQQLVGKFADEIGITMVPFKAVAYVPSLDRYLPADEIPKGTETRSISGTQFRAMLASGEDLPAWFSDPDVIRILRQVNPPLQSRGFTVFFTGLSGSGKSTIAAALAEHLRAALPTRQVTMLDGDVIRTHLSKGLGFSAADRNANVARIGWAAALATRHGGIAIAPAIAPLEAGRAAARSLVSATGGGFVLVYVATSLEVVIARDVKGLYARAEAEGLALTGIGHPFELPDRAELTIDAGVVPVRDSVARIIDWLVGNGYLDASLAAQGGSRQAALDRLGAAGVLSEGLNDLGEALCVPKHTASLVYAAGVTGAHAKAAKEAMHAAMAAARTAAVPAADTVKAEEEATAATVAASTAAGAGGDPAWPTGSPATSPTSPDGTRPEVAWGIFAAARAGLKPGQSAIVSAPRGLPYLRHLLRFEACSRLVAVAPATAAAEATAAAAVLADAPVSGATASDAEAYVAGATGELRALASLFPGRVFLADDVAGLQAAAKKAALSLASR